MRRFLLGLAVAAAATAQAAAEPVVVGQDRASILRLSRDADNVIIGNTAYFDVTVEDPRMLILFGREPGQSNLIVLDAGKKEILSVPVVVVPPQDTNVRVLSALRGGAGAAESVYACSRGQCVQTKVGLTPSASPPPGPALPPPTQPAADSSPSSSAPGTSYPER